MNPSTNVGMELPSPVGEQLPHAVDVPKEANNSPLEHQPNTSYETGPVSPLAQSVSPVPPPVAPPSPSVNAQDEAGATNDIHSTDISADDKDLIEKEWVTKAKAIVERTREDPYKQSEELSLLKADYLQKRYNKTIKLSN
jgi:hypothetical protein